jgi:hypothetical protein
MGLDATARRRWFGALVLIAALAMLICGQTFLQGKMKPLGFLFYWLMCFILTGVAALVALRDLRDLKHRTRQLERELLESTLKDIENESRIRKKPLVHKNGS